METDLWFLVFINHTAMLVFSLVVMLIVSKGKLTRYGFRITKDLRLWKVVLWGAGIGIISTLTLIILPGEESQLPEGFSFLQVVIFIWIWASICEEVLMRGLIQTSLGALSKYGFVVFKTRISLPVLITAILFGLVHTAQSFMGGDTVQVIAIVAFAFILGLVAGYYREKTESLIPAILVHMFANIGGSLIGIFFAFV